MPLPMSPDVDDSNGAISNMSSDFAVGRFFHDRGVSYCFP